jgi:hypothetical protein
MNNKMVGIPTIPVTIGPMLTFTASASRVLRRRSQAIGLVMGVG